MPISDRDHPYVVYDYTPDRSRAGPSKWLDKFKGFLQADAYGGYDGIYASGVKEVACWAHYPECGFIQSSECAVLPLLGVATVNS